MLHSLWLQIDVHIKQFHNLHIINDFIPLVYYKFAFTQIVCEQYYDKSCTSIKWRENLTSPMFVFNCPRVDLQPAFIKASVDI